MRIVGDPEVRDQEMFTLGALIVLISLVALLARDFSSTRRAEHENRSSIIRKR